MPQQPNQSSVAGPAYQTSPSRDHSTASSAQTLALDTAKYVLIAGSGISNGTTQLLYTCKWGGQIRLDDGSVAKRITKPYRDIIKRKIHKADPAETLHLLPIPVAVPLVSHGELTSGHTTAILNSLDTLDLRVTTAGQQESSGSSAPFFLLMGYTRGSQPDTWTALWLPDMSCTQVLAYHGATYDVMPQLYYKMFYNQTNLEMNPIRWVHSQRTYMYSIPIAVPLWAELAVAPYDASNVLLIRHVSTLPQDGPVRQSAPRTFAPTVTRPLPPLLPRAPPGLQPQIASPHPPPKKVAIARLSRSHETSRKIASSRGPLPSPKSHAEPVDSGLFVNVAVLSEPKIGDKVVVHYKYNTILPPKGKGGKGPNEVTFYTKSRDGEEAPVKIPNDFLPLDTRRLLCKQRYWGVASPLCKAGDKLALKSGVPNYANGIELTYISKEKGLMWLSPPD